MNAEFEKVKEIIVDSLSCDEDAVTLEANLKEDLEADIEYLIKTELRFWDKVKTKTPPPFLEKRNKNLID